ncbi:MAG: ribbon-helix-helix domain-containing protein, partial [Parvibaculaceae bacterium]|nr:ribbon-helix-helix domain-containing protein [Parvibaculaceae bacterium]
SVNELVRKIDATRTEGANLSSAVRVFILYEVQNRAAVLTTPHVSGVTE